MDTTSADEAAEQILQDAGTTYHEAHGFYLRAVAAELDRRGVPVLEVGAHPDDPRSGFIAVDVLAKPDDDSLFVAWHEEDGWTYCPCADEEGRPYDDIALSVELLAYPVDVVSAFLAALGRDVLPVPDQWEPPAGYISEITRSEFTETSPDLERSLVAYIGYPGADCERYAG